MKKSKSIRKIIRMTALSVSLMAILAGCGSHPTPPTAPPQSATPTQPSATSPAKPPTPTPAPVPVPAPVPAPVPVPSVTPVSAGSTLYSAKCITCHGTGGVGGRVGPVLKGVASKFSNQSTLSKYIQANMPQNNPHSLSASQAQYLAAYLFTLK